MKHIRSHLSRRHWLAGSGALLAIPALQAFGRSSRAQTEVTKRLVVITTGQGTLLPHWTPQSPDGEPLELSPLLAPLGTHKQALNVISGVDNRMQELHSSNGHNAAGHTLLNAHLATTSADAEGRLREDGAREEVSWNTLCIGPSIDHYLAERLNGSLPLNLAVGGGDGGENRMFYRVAPELASEPLGARAEARLEASAAQAFAEHLAPHLAGEPSQQSPAVRLRAQRGLVLDHVRDAYQSLAPRIGAEDRSRLEAHAERIVDLQRRLQTNPNVEFSCSEDQLVAPSDNRETVAQWQNQIDVLVNALACNVVRVATIQDTEYHGPNFSFLEAPVAGRLDSLGAPPLPGGPVDGWHAQVHGEEGGRPNDNQNLFAGFSFYASQVRYLLDRMAAVNDGDGASLLDNSLVLWLSEFGDGGAHSARNLPVVLAGSAGGGLVTDRHLVRDGYSTGDLYTSILNLFGIEEESFGFNGVSGLQQGGIPGLG